MIEYDTLTDELKLYLEYLNCEAGLLNPEKKVFEQEDVFEFIDVYLNRQPKKYKPKRNYDL